MDKPHKRLLAWQKSMDLVVEIYDLTKGFPKDEGYGLTSQLRRASVSVPSNISEGAAGRSVTQFRNFLSVAIGSLNEVSTQLEIAYRVGYLDLHKHDSVESRVDECLALTFGLRKSLLRKLGKQVLLVLAPLLLTTYCLLLTAYGLLISND
ncbi:MAG TPA: four helix bundle protein [Pyrinomonadaceae bacterium]